MSSSVTISGPTVSVSISGVLGYAVVSPPPQQISVAPVGPQGPPGQTGGGIYTWNGSAWVLDPTARVFLQLTGDPAPTGLNANDFVYVEQ